MVRVPKRRYQMKSVKGTKTERNLLAAFAGESQARNRYTFFASQAKKVGYEQIAAMFLETAGNEKEHAERLFKFLEGGEVEITAAFPAGVIGDTSENLAAAAAGENYEHTELYPGFARIAEEEGFSPVAALFRAVVVAETQHERRFLAFRENIQNGRVFERETVVSWKCANCGYIHQGTEALEMCPACVHPKAYFELLVETW
jgi:rubrerythrin